MKQELEVYQVPSDTAYEVVLNQPVIQKGRMKPWKKIALGVSAGLVLSASGAYTQKDKYTDDLAEISRDVIGGNNIARLERVYFSVQDRADRIKFDIFGGSTNPFGGFEPESVAAVVTTPPNDDRELVLNVPVEPEVQVVVEPQKPPPMILPETKLLRPDPKPGEGIWVTEGLPRSSPEDFLMAKTFIRPDPARSDATVAILLLDKRRVRLHMVGGTESPGGDRGIPGPGVIPEAHKK